MKRVVWKNKSNNQLCVTIPTASHIKAGDTVEVEKSTIKTITYSGVVADLFHYGHLYSLLFSKSISDYNICGILTDKAVAEYRIKPISNIKERKSIISNLKCVDRVMIQKSRDCTKNLKKIHSEFPDAKIILVHGSDLKYIHGSDYIKKIKGKVVKHPYYKKLSTLKIVSYITENKDRFKDMVKLDSLIDNKFKTDLEYEKGNKIIISTKADTLKVLRPLLKKSSIEDMYIFSYSEWKNKNSEVINKIVKKFSPDKIVIRSSAINEDTLYSSMAGSFKSVLNITSKDTKQIESAIQKVIRSYKQKELESSFNQILVQLQSKDIITSGVVFTRTLDTNNPYYVINYDDSTGQTDTVTKGIENKSVKISRFAAIKQIPKDLKNILIAVREIEEKIPGLTLDIEFGVNKQKKVIIFQVRPLTTNKKEEFKVEEIKNEIQNLKNQFNTLSKEKDHLPHKKTIFADMPDWNPAEIIGDNPNNLDYELYNYLITNSAWHEARTSQGYYNVNPAKLVVLFGNKPYIDVRSSFYSFTPNSISKSLRDKLVSFYIEKLNKNPELQDKVEFEILFTCYDFSFEERSKEFRDAGFDDKEIIELKTSLINLTNNLIINSKENISQDLNILKIMGRNRKEIEKIVVTSETPTNFLLDKAKFLLDDCRENGTVQFSRLARLGFIGKIILKSLIKKNIIDKRFYDQFMSSINTVATELKEDFIAVTSQNMNKDDFIKKYYHLRPGSYDITSPRYDTNPDILKTSGNRLTAEKSKEVFNIDDTIKEKINSLFKEEGLKFNADVFFEFTRSSLEFREYCKFEFTKNLSNAIELIAKAGKNMGFTRLEISRLNIEDLFSKKVEDSNGLTEIWKKSIISRNIKRNLNNCLELPPIINSEKDFDVIRYYDPKPNYITQKKVSGKLIKLHQDNKNELPDLKGKIVMIENADPGYDWIFTRNPLGLITKYGGIASHMAIRCAEFGIPAMIGCGSIFEQIGNSNFITLNCESQNINT